MSSKRHELIGIKQVTRLEWYDFALDLLLDGESPKNIRLELDHFISERLQSGGYGERGDQTYTKAVTQIMKCWVTPDKEIISFRDDVLQQAKTLPRNLRIVLHWIAMTAAYPFWHLVATQTGRLFNLQDSVTQNQIRLRCYEILGERSTVERSSRRVIRSFVTWNVLTDSETKGCYAKCSPVVMPDQQIALLVIESVLHALPEGKGNLDLILNSPSFFPFKIPMITGDFISYQSSRMDVVRHGLSDEMVKLKN